MAKKKQKSLESEKKDMELKYWNHRPKPKVEEEKEAVEIKNPTASALKARAIATHGGSLKKKAKK